MSFSYLNFTSIFKNTLSLNEKFLKINKLEERLFFL